MITHRVDALEAQNHWNLKWGTHMRLRRRLLLLAGSATKARNTGTKPLQKDHYKKTISLGTATPGGGFPLYGKLLPKS